MTEVVPAIIPESFEHLKEQLVLVRNHVESVQVDVMDGKFAPTKSWPHNGNDTEVFEKLVHEEEGLPLWEELSFEIDMMVENPEKYALDWAQAGASAIIIHYGSTDIFSEMVKELHGVGVSVGLAVLPSTAEGQFYPLLEKVDFVQVMGNDKIGYHGVELDEAVYEKVKKLREEFSDVTIAVDIGVNTETAPRLVKAGVNKLVSGSAVFGSGDIEEAIKYFESL